MDLPMKIGTHAELEKRLKAYLAEHQPEALPQVTKIIVACLEYHTRQAAYLQAYIVVGAMRYSIDGQPVEAINDKNKQHAQKMLKKLAKENAG
jgi:sRNA-binding protein